MNYSLIKGRRQTIYEKLNKHIKWELPRMLLYLYRNIKNRFCEIDMKYGNYFLTRWNDRNRSYENFCVETLICTSYFCTYLYNYIRVFIYFILRFLANLSRWVLELFIHASAISSTWLNYFFLTIPQFLSYKKDVRIKIKISNKYFC